MRYFIGITDECNKLLITYWYFDDTNDENMWVIWNKMSK